MPPKSKKPRKNGLVLTAKGLSSPAYHAIHDLPYGLRKFALHAVLEATADLAKRKGKSWYQHGRKLKLTHG